jgi:hypothetical protein
VRKFSRRRRPRKPAIFWQKFSAINGLGCAYDNFATAWGNVGFTLVRPFKNYHHTMSPRIFIIGGALFLVGWVSGYFMGRPAPGEIAVVAAPSKPTATPTPMIVMARPSATPRASGSPADASDQALTISADEFETSLKKLLASSDGDPRARFRGAFDLLRKLDPSQIQQALQDIKQFTTGREQGFLSSALIGRLAETDPTTALTLAKTLDNSQDSARAMQMAINSWSQTNPTAAIGWAESQPVSPDRSQLVATAMNNWAQADPRAAWNYAMSALNGPDQTKALGTIAGQMAGADPTAAAQMASQLTNPTAQAAAYQSIMGTLARQDPTAAATMLNTLQGTNYDSAAVSYVQQTARSNPQQAFTTALTIGTYQERIDSAGQAYRTLVQQDPQAAQTTLSGSGLPPADQTAIINASKNNNNRGGGFGGGGNRGGFGGGFGRPPGG